jgi:hypothetical protein
MRNENLKQKLIDQIQLIEDKNTLKQIEGYISLSIKKEKIYQLSDEDIEAIKVSDVEFNSGEYTSNDDLQKKINSWL